MRFSIGFKLKLIIIVTIIVLVSVTAVTVVISRLVRHDMQIAAEQNNFEVNRRLAKETESALAHIRSNSRMFIQTVTAAVPVMGTGSAGAWEEAHGAQSVIEFFFEENPQVAVVFFTDGTQTNEIFVNSSYFNSKEIDEAIADSYRDDCVTPLMRAAAGETLLLNAAPFFSLPVLSMFFPCPGGGAGVLFSHAEFDDTFCFGTNQSYLINDSGDILIHADFELVRAGVNVADSDFTRYVWDNEVRNSQTLYTGEDGIRYFMAFTKLDAGACTVITGIEYDKVFEGIAAVTRRYIYLAVTVLFISIMIIWIFAKGKAWIRNE